jgi:hypothetical protein
MNNRISDITFPTDPEKIEFLNQKRGHTEYGQYYYFKPFGKFSSLYRLLSGEKDISDSILLTELSEAMSPE